MRIQIKGGGWYGCHLAKALRAEHDVFLTERAERLFAGASGANPARLHIGTHYPRSHETRAACRAHVQQFMASYGHLTRAIPHNLYAVAGEGQSLLDFQTYRTIIGNDTPYLAVTDPAERGLQNVEGAIQVDERHIVIDCARAYYAANLVDLVRYQDNTEHACADVIIDATFCTQHLMDVARYEPCVTALLEGPTDIAVTVMDGPFPSLYPWNEKLHLSSLTSAKWTPLARCESWGEAAFMLRNATSKDLETRCNAMIDQMAHYYPAVRDRRLVDMRTAIRAMPGSAADSRLCKVVEMPGAHPAGGRYLAIRAGKIDAVFEAERQVRAFLNS